jgi:flagellar hook-associated protein FlgK
LQTEKRASEDEKSKIRNDRNELLDLADQRQTMVEELEEQMEVSLEEQKRNAEAGCTGREQAATRRMKFVASL